MTDAKPTCGECKRMRDVEPHGHGYCHHPRTIWNTDAFPRVCLRHKDEPTGGCECFERKDAKCSFDEGDPITCENLIDHVVAIGSPDDYGEDD